MIDKELDRLNKKKAESVLTAITAAKQLRRMFVGQKLSAMYNWQRENNQLIKDAVREAEHVEKLESKIKYHLGRRRILVCPNCGTEFWAKPREKYCDYKCGQRFNQVAAVRRANAKKFQFVMLSDACKLSQFQVT